MFAYKVVVIGDFGVGKTSLIRRFVESSFSEEYLSSIGVTMSKKLLTSSDGIDSSMMIWDTEGKTEHKSIYKQYLIGAKAFIIVADLTREETLNSIAQHIQICQEVVPDAFIAIALNKSDMENSYTLSLENLRNLSPNIIDICKTSAKSGNGVEVIFNDINTLVIKK